MLNDFMVIVLFLMWAAFTVFSFVVAYNSRPGKWTNKPAVIMWLYGIASPWVIMLVLLGLILRHYGIIR